MSGAIKQEFPPLLPAGNHIMALADIHALVVAAFPLSTRRPLLWKNLLWLEAELRARWLPCRLWLDGSFVTQKIEPDDIDIVIDFDVSVLEKVTPDQAELLEKLGKQEYRHDPMKLHTFIMYDAPLSHPQRLNAVALHKQWSNDFGLSFVKKEPKGIAVLEVSP